jgi:hypothetical protein
VSGGTSAQDLRTSRQKTKDCDKCTTSGQSCRTSQNQRPKCRTSQNQRFRVTSAHKNGPRARSAEPAETSRRSETSGASCRTSQEPAGPRYKHAQETDREGGAQNQQRPAGEARPAGQAAGRAKNQRFRVTSARRSEPVISGGARGVSACGRIQILGVCTARAEERGGIRGRPSAAGRTYEEVAFSSIKGGGAFRILQSKRFEHPYEGNCTARHRARTHSGTSNARRALRICADLRGLHTG